MCCPTKYPQELTDICHVEFDNVTYPRNELIRMYDASDCCGGAADCPVQLNPSCEQCNTKLIDILERKMGGNGANLTYEKPYPGYLTADLAVGISAVSKYTGNVNISVDGTRYNATLSYTLDLSPIAGVVFINSWWHDAPVNCYEGYVGNGYQVLVFENAQYAQGGLALFAGTGTTARIAGADNNVIVTDYMPTGVWWIYECFH